MLKEIISSINWIDILMLSIIVRMTFVGMKSGFFIELFKLLGMVFAVFVSHHYFSAISVVLIERVHFAPFIANTVSFGLLWILVVLIFKLIRDGIMIVFKMEANAAFNQWAGLAIALARGVLICSMTLMLLYCTGFKSISKYSSRSLTGPYLSDISLGVYQAIYYSLVSRYFEHEKLDSIIFKIKENNGK